MTVQGGLKRNEFPVYHIEQVIFTVFLQIGGVEPQEMTQLSINIKW